MIIILNFSCGQYSQLYVFDDDIALDKDILKMK